MRRNEWSNTHIASLREKEGERKKWRKKTRIENVAIFCFWKCFVFSLCLLRLLLLFIFFSLARFSWLVWSLHFCHQHFIYMASFAEKKSWCVFFFLCKHLKLENTPRKQQYNNITYVMNGLYYLLWQVWLFILARWRRRKTRRRKNRERERPRPIERERPRPIERERERENGGREKRRFVRVAIECKRKYKIYYFTKRNRE